MNSREPSPPEAGTELHRPRNPVRFISAASLFDGHDAAINIMRRLLQSQGAEVVHLGHNRSVDEVVAAAVAEDVQGIAISSYQGGHLEYFRYVVDRLREEGRGDIQVYGGGGGVIIPSEIAELEAYGVRRIFSPDDGQRLGLERMINQLILECDIDLAAQLPANLDELLLGNVADLARVITGIEAGTLPPEMAEGLARAARARSVPVLGITGTGGSGKSSLTDEIIRRFRLDQGEKLRIAVLAVDPTRRRSGGALLGDRIRMNAIDTPQVFFRSVATRGSQSEVPLPIPSIIDACRAAGFDLVIVETPGIGQGDAAIVDIADVSLYVMTPEFGAPSQLEKIDMLDLADVVAINKFDRRGADDARRAVGRQWTRNHSEGQSTGRPGNPPPPPRPRTGRLRCSAPSPRASTIWGPPPSTSTCGTLWPNTSCRCSEANWPPSTPRRRWPGRRSSRRSEPVTSPRSPRPSAATTPPPISRRPSPAGSSSWRMSPGCWPPRVLRAGGSGRVEVPGVLEAMVAEADDALDPANRALLTELTGLRETFAGDELAVASGDGSRSVPLSTTSLSGTRIPRVALPRATDQGDLLRWLRSEHLPGHFPFTAGVFPLKRENEDPARMFAGEGDAFRTNRRFHLLAAGQPATRLSTAFDSVTLYGRDPNTQPDVYGKVGTSGVSIATLDDMKVLYSGFDLCDPTTSVSMTINGPAPTILAMYLNTAIDQQLERFEADHGRPPTEPESEEVRQRVFRTVRGTVQADILKEDQGQNTCIFSTEFSLGVMADIQEFFVDNQVRNFYSVSISGYHIAEAGANPITQLAFTLANGFTYVESYLARGLAIDDFAPNLSFFFSNGMDPEYTVIGRVARRIWAVAMRDRYGASERSQKLKYHVQTSGRSLHAQEMAFNDIRTTLQALCAIYDNANSLHTNAYDEAVTTPSAESVRRALAIQLIITKEWGLAANENPLQGSFIVEELTDLLEAAVLAELDSLSERGGVLGAMETGYQRGRIQDDSMVYEHRKHDGSLPLVGVNTFIADSAPESPPVLELARATSEEKEGQIRRLADFHARHADDAPAALAELREAALRGDNIFEALMSTVRSASLGQITETLFEVGGTYRRNV